MKRRCLLRSAALALGAGIGAKTMAQDFPWRPITLVVPYAVGGNADLTARLLAPALSRAVGQTVVVDNKAGAGGSIGALHVIHSRPDGHTLLLSATGVFSITPQLLKVGYTAASVRPVCLLTKTALVLVAKKGSRYQSLTDIVQAARARPGAVSIGHSGLGTPNHLAQLNLEIAANVRFNVVPYKGSGPMLQDMLAGQIDVAADQISTSKPYIDSGDLLALAVFGPPLPALSGVPQLSSLGPEPFDTTTRLGLAAPPGTPDQVLAILRKALAAALADSGFAAAIAKTGAQIAWGDERDYARLVRDESAFVQQMIAAGRIAANP